MDIGIDLGTANIMITMGSKGIVLNEPSVVAFNKKTEQVLAVGQDAYRMIGRTPEYIVAVRPLCDGVISDHNMAEQMISACITKVCGRQLFRPRIVLCIPSFITDVESRAMVEAARNAGSRKVYLIEEPVAALLGAGVDISKPNGNMVVDIGGGTADVAVLSMNGCVAKKSLKLAGNKIDSAIVKYVASEYKVLIGEKTAEQAKFSLANVFDPNEKKTMIIKGRHMIKGLPESIEISEMDVYNAIIDIVKEFVDAAKSVLEETPPELVGDIYVNGIILTGGGALIGGLDKIMSSAIGIPCRVADDPLSCVAKGTGMAFDMIDKLLDGFEHISMYKY